jgi:hypothetical protein
MDMTRLRLGQAGAGRFCATGAWIVVLASVANGTPKLWRWRFNFAAGPRVGLRRAAAGGFRPQSGAPR